MKTTRLNIGGRTINVRSSSDDQHLQLVSEELNERIMETQRVIPDSHEALLFVALSLTDELINTQTRLDEVQQATEDKVGRLLKILESLDPLESSLSEG